MSRWMVRARVSVQLTLLLLIAGAGPALAKGQSGMSVMDIFEVTTSDGVSLSQQPLALTSEYSVFGQDLPDPFLFLLTVAWNIYRIIAGFAVWFLGEAQSGDWRYAIADAADSTITPFLAALHQLQLPAVVGTAAFIVVAWVWIRGRAGASLAEAGAVAVFFALAVGLFSTPVGEFTQNGGFLDTSIEAGREISSGMGEGTGDGGERTQQRLADILVAQPGEILAFGELLNEKCHQELAAAQKEVAGDPEKVREAVAECDEEYEEQPPLTSVIAMLVFLVPFLSSVVLALLLLSALLAFLVCGVIWFSVEIAWNAIWAPFPGAARMRLINALIKTGTALGALVVVLVVAAVVTQILVEIFDNIRGDDGGLLATFTAYCVASGVMTLLWIVLWWKVLGHLLKSRGRTEKVKGAVSPSKPTSMPAPRGAPVAAGGAQIGKHAIGSAVGGAVARRDGLAGGGRMPTPSTLGNQAQPPAVGDAPQTPRPGPGEGGVPPRPSSRPEPGEGGTPLRAASSAPTPAPASTAPSTAPSAVSSSEVTTGPSVKKGVVKASTKVAAHAALAAATGGTSAVAGAAGSTLATMGATHVATRGAKHLLKKGAVNTITGPAARAGGATGEAVTQPIRQQAPSRSSRSSHGPAEPTVEIPIRKRTPQTGQQEPPAAHVRAIPARPSMPQHSDAAREQAQRLRERLQERHPQPSATGYPTGRTAAVPSMPTNSGTR